MDSLVEAKLLLPHEADRLEKVDFRLNEEMIKITIFKQLKLKPRKVVQPFVNLSQFKALKLLLKCSPLKFCDSIWKMK